MKFQTLSFVSVFAVALAACSSSSGGGDDPPGGGGTSTGAGSTSFQEIMSMASRFGVDGENLQDISADDLPDSADMDGYLLMIFDETGRRGFIGDATATADFSAGTLTGDAGSFVEYEASEGCPQTCTGTALQIASGTMDITGSISGTSFRFNTEGTLLYRDLTGGGLVEHQLDMDGIGSFWTLDGNLVATGVGGSVASSVIELILED